MKKGLVIGKFMPLHKGHIALIEFALKRCDELVVLICATDSEPIAAVQKLTWVRETFESDTRVKPQLLVYDERELPNTSESSEVVSAIWADYLKSNLTPIDIIFGSEPYVAYVAEFLACEHIIFNEERTIVPVSSTKIRNWPMAYWDFIPEKVKPFYVKKICMYGTESTGKTTLTQKLAAYFNTAPVTEMAREILEHTYECTEEHLMQIAELHARTILEKTKQANKVLIVDTDINITRSYSRFLFNKELPVPGWIAAANKFDLYLYLDNDAPYVQDGTRLSKKDRDLLNGYHKNELTSRNISFELLTGSWDEKFENAKKPIEKLMGGG
jgi:HTH-type transcriptional repressor of NAD biosynthesis genes